MLLQKRPDSGIWGGLWAPPEFEEASAAKAWIANTLSLPAERCRIDEPFHHTFTHFKLKAHSVRAQCAENHPEKIGVESHADNLQWFALHPPPSVGLPAPIVRLLAKLGKENPPRSN